MQFRDELEPDEFDNYYTDEELNGPAEEETHVPPPNHANLETASASPNEPRVSDSPIVPVSPNQVITSAAMQLAAATSILITHLTGATGCDKTIRQIKNLASSLETLQRVIVPKRPVGRPRKSEK